MQPATPTRARGPLSCESCHAPRRFSLRFRFVRPG
ncbi:MAG: hypothetical protein AB7K35_14780 [Pseudorhodoplanes sp.]